MNKVNRLLTKKLIRICDEILAAMVRKIYSGPEGGAVDLNPLAGLKPSAYGDLPPLPEFLRLGQKLG